ncbi:lipocalin family protein [Candidatus Latescibacterota bacterium]
MKTNLIFVALMLGLISSFGCDKNPTDSEYTDSIIGSWVKRHGIVMYTLSFSENGIFKVRVDIGGYSGINGTYSISNNEITFIDDDCGEEKEGKYKYSIDKNRLIFSLISDECGRSEIIPGTWTK